MKTTVKSLATAVVCAMTVLGEAVSGCVPSLFRCLCSYFLCGEQRQALQHQYARQN